MGRRHYVHSHGNRLPLPRRRARCLEPQGRWLGYRQPFPHRAGSRCARHGRRPTPAARRHSPLGSGGATWVQPVVATPACDDLSSSSKTSAGVLHSSVLRGRLFSVAATAASVFALWVLRSVPFGKYCRSSPFVFSFV